MNPSPLTLAEHPLKRTEAHMREDLYKELNHGWMEQTKNSGREDANHGQVTEERQEKPKGTIVSEEMKGQDIKSKTEKKKKSGHEANKKFKIKGPVHLTTKRKELVNFKGGKADLSLNQGEIIEDIHKTDDYVKNESVNTGHDDLKEEEEETGTRIYQSEAESDIYDDIGEPAESFSAATTKHRWR
ncbi:FYN-binding protein 1-like [Cebidichthys violaceus]|uniref:FYN-binding protein 1-like n=1 Tax=Cebidichthys violaceus TaxID=271503 RepID=UPI0035CA3BE3